MAGVRNAPCTLRRRTTPPARRRPAIGAAGGRRARLARSALRSRWRRARPSVRAPGTPTSPYHRDEIERPPRAIDRRRSEREQQPDDPEWHRPQHPASRSTPYGDNDADESRDPGGSTDEIRPALLPWTAGHAGDRRPKPGVVRRAQVVHHREREGAQLLARWHRCPQERPRQGPEHGAGDQGGAPRCAIRRRAAPTDPTSVARSHADWTASITSPMTAAYQDTSAWKQAKAVASARSASAPLRHHRSSDRALSANPASTARWIKPMKTIAICE